MLMVIDKIKYHIKIKGEGKPIICLHGFSENLSTWESIMLADYQMILIDLIGHGESEKPYSRQSYHWKVIIRHLHKLIHQLGFKRYSLLGYSLGGRIALAYSLAYPREIEMLILESASYGECGLIKRFKRRKDDSKLAKNIRQNGIEWFNLYWSGLRIFATQTQLPRGVTGQIRKRRLANDPQALANTLCGSGQGKFPCLKNQISKLTMPVLYINGEYDTKYEQVGLEFKKLNSNIKHEIIKGVGHNTHIEDSQAFNEVLKKFLVTNFERGCTHDEVSLGNTKPKV
ncbi:MAG: 2-succinyl-6-hydroxy-2,4-cyclohexadiene-1-carboxylate synthase [Gracilibacter sp. BRH_c7a]|nr:MAG: 2-succinyl-6-hydroxy-2,4-cyclohexadiene-1-carboxylate synthase [Gracilibacter sp. BRH_c7a]